MKNAKMEIVRLTDDVVTASSVECECFTLGDVGADNADECE